MKISFLTQDLYGRGAESATAAIARGFESAGNDVDIVVSRRHEDLRKKYGETPFPLPKKAKWIVLPHAHARQNICAIRRYLKTADVDVLVVMLDSYMGALAIASVGLSRLPLLVRVIHLDDVGTLAPVDLWTSCKRALKGAVIRFAFRRMNRVFCVSDGGRKNFLSRHPYYNEHNTFTVFNPVVDGEFLLRKNEEARHPWLRKKVCKTFVAAGQLEPIKGYRELLEAFADVRKTLPVRLVVFGEGSHRDEYEKFILQNGLEDSVVLAGYTDNLPAELKMADGLIHASRRESFGIVIAEALACGIPVVATDAPYGPREILANGRFGVLVPVNDVAALSGAIRRMTLESKKYVPNEAWERFSVAAIVKMYFKGFLGNVDDFSERRQE